MLKNLFWADYPNNLF